MSNEYSENDSRDQMNRGMLIVVSSPSGGGKGTLIDRVLKTFPTSAIRFRSPRARPDRRRKTGANIFLSTAPPSSR
jgi:guanylate kinase